MSSLGVKFSSTLSCVLSICLRWLFIELILVKQLQFTFKLFLLNTLSYLCCGESGYILVEVKDDQRFYHNLGWAKSCLSSTVCCFIFIYGSLMGKYIFVPGFTDHLFSMYAKLWSGRFGVRIKWMIPYRTYIISSIKTRNNFFIFFLHQ